MVLNTKYIAADGFFIKDDDSIIPGYYCNFGDWMNIVNETNKSNKCMSLYLYDF
jgi:hypothetical protein